MAWIFPALLSYSCQIQVHFLTYSLMAWNTTSGLWVSIASHILPISPAASSCCSGLVSKDYLLSLADGLTSTPLATPGARHMDTVSHSVPHPSPSTEMSWGETNGDIQPALSELFPALDPDPPTLSLICLQLALENDRLPSFC